MSTVRSYTVAISEILFREVTVQAASAEEALDEVKERYRSEEIVLTADDFARAELTVDGDYNIYTVD